MKHNYRSSLVLLAVVVLLTHGAQSQEVRDSFLIIPGLRIGPLHTPATENDVLRAFGKNAVKAMLNEGEGNAVRGSLLYPCDPARQAAVFYSDHAPRQLIRLEVSLAEGSMQYDCGVFLSGKSAAYVAKLEPGDTIKMLQDGVSEAVLNRAIAKFNAAETAHAGVVEGDWHLASGIRLGLRTDALMQINGKAFTFHGPEGDGPGRITGPDWNGGKLAACDWSVTVSPPSNDPDTGRLYRSDELDVKSVTPAVIDLTVDFRGKDAFKEYCPTRGHN